MEGQPTYYMLSDDELWERIKKLKGGAVGSPDFKEKILEAYHKLFIKGEVIGSDKHYCLFLATLSQVIPEQIRLFKTGKDNGQLGLRLKLEKFNWVFESLRKNERLELLWELLIASEKAVQKNSLKPIKDLMASWEETLEITSDKRLMRQLKKAEKEFESGDIVPWEKVKKELNL